MGGNFFRVASDAVVTAAVVMVDDVFRSVMLVWQQYLQQIKMWLGAQTLGRATTTVPAKKSQNVLNALLGWLSIC